MTERLQIQEGFRYALGRMGVRGAQIAQIGYLDLPIDFNYVRMREDAMIDFLPLARAKGVPSWHAWDHEIGRQEMKFGRMLRRIKDAMAQAVVNEEVSRSYGWERTRGTEYDPRNFATITDDEITEMVNQLRDMTKPATYQIVTGEDIIAWYHHDAMTDQEPTGNLHSCMVHTYDPDSDYDNYPPPVRRYAEEPNCALAIATKDDKLVARCLVWTTTNGQRYYDKFYGGEARRVGLCKWLESQGIKDAGDHDIAVKMKQNWRQIRGLPYLDTMEISRDGTHLYSGDGDGFGTYATCDECGCDIEDEDDAYGVDWGTVCGDCYISHSCSHCDGWVDEDDLIHHPDFGMLCETCQDGRVCQGCKTPLDRGQRRNGQTYCDDCWELVCNDCGEYDRDATDGFCPDCIDDHRCTECGRVEMAYIGDGGLCDSCESEGEDE